MKRTSQARKPAAVKIPESRNVKAEMTLAKAMAEGPLTPHVESSRLLGIHLEKIECIWRRKGYMVTKENLACLTKLTTLG